MDKNFARTLIEHTGEDAVKLLYEGGATGVFWVDWREADDRIVELTAACFGEGSDLAPQWMDGQLHIRFRNQLTLIPLEYRPGEQDTTLRALNRAMAPDFEIRFVKASEGNDTLAFLVLETGAWADLHTAFGDRVNGAFARLDPNTPLFAQTSKPPPAPAPKVDRATECLARVKEGRTLASEQKFEEAITVFEEVERHFGADGDAHIRIYVLMAMLTKASTLVTLKRQAQAIETADACARRYGSDTNPDIRGFVAAILTDKGHWLHALGQTEEAIAAADLVSAQYGDDTEENILRTVLDAMCNKAFWLGELGRLAEQTVTYDAIVQHHMDNASPSIRVAVAMALNGAGYSRMIRAKQAWAEREPRIALLRKAIADLRNALERCEEKRRVMILGNLGYALFLCGDEMPSARETQECLRLGGRAALEGQLSDAESFRVPEVDGAYEHMLRRLWDKLNTGSA